MLLCSWTCSGSLCVITVSTVQLQTVQFVQYLYSKCVVLLCSWTCSASSLCVITVSTVQLQTVQFVQYLYSKCVVLLCSWKCSGSSLCVITASIIQLQTVQFVQYLYSKCALLLCSWTCSAPYVWLLSVQLSCTRYTISTLNMLYSITLNISPSRSLSNYCQYISVAHCTLSLHSIGCTVTHLT